MGNKSFQWNAELYQGSSFLQFELGLRAIDILNPQGYDRILDIGCGNGLLTIELAKRVPDGHVTGIESSNEMISLAEQNISRVGATNVRFININALDINFNEEYDAVFSNSAIHWIHDLNAMYRLIYRSMKPGGRIMVQTSLKEANKLYETIYALLQVEKYRPYYANITWPWRFLSREENTEVLNTAGFVDVTVERFQHNYIFNTIDELSGYLESAPMVPFLSHIPDEEKTEFKELFVQTYLEKNSSILGASSARAFITAQKPHNV